MDDKKTSVAAMLRSVIQSSKEGVPVNRLSSEYYMLIGQKIPFKELGYSDLRTMLKGMTDVVRLGNNKQGEEAVFAIADKSTAHIQSLISRQKSSKSKSKPSIRPFRRQSSAQSTRSRAPKPNMSNSFGNYINKSQLNNFRQKQSFNRGFLDRIPSSPSPTPVQYAKPKTGSTYVLAPRFQRQTEKGPLHADDYGSLPSVVSEQQRASLSRKSSYDCTPKSPISPPAFEPPSRNVTINYDSLLAYNSYQDVVGKAAEPLTFVKYQPNVFPATVSKRTVMVEPTEFQNNISVINATSDVKPKLKSKAATCKELVEEYAAYNNIPEPVYRTLPIHSKKKGQAYISTLILNDAKYLSYPQDCLTQEEAEEFAASRAVKVLDIVPGQYSSVLRETPASTRPQILMLVEQLCEIIKNKPNGIWQTKVPEFYEEIYLQSLPENWLQILRDNCDKVKIGDSVGGNCILYPASSGRSTPSSPDSAGERVHFFHQPERFVFPESKTWDVYVTYISAEDLTIAVRLVDYSDDFEKLACAMDEYYCTNRNPVIEPTVGRIYAVKSEVSWFRVEILSLTDEKAECYFVDNGDTEDINLKDLNLLMPQFCSFPYQAIHCELHGVSGQYTESNVLFQKLHDLAFGKVLIGDVISRAPLSLNLFDTSTDDDVNINSVLSEIGNLEAMTPSLSEDGEIVEGFLSFVTDDGDVYLQLIGNNLEVFQNITADIKQLCEDRKGLVREASESKMYCARYTNGEWYRAFVKSVSLQNPEMVVVWYVDYGNTNVVHISELCEVDAVSDVLDLLPYQAIRCRLHNVPAQKSLTWTDKAADHLFEIAPDTEPVLIKMVVPGTNTSLPEVQLFKRIGKQRELVSVNETLASSKHLFLKSPLPSPVQRHASPLSSSDIPDVALSAQMSIFNKKNSRYSDHSEESAQKSSIGDHRLMPPEIPEVGKHFDVTVILAAHPHNFIVQSWETGGRLDDIMAEMQSFYNSEDNLFGIHEYILEEGEFYACKHKDNCWYRVIAAKILPSQMVWVYFVDFGDYNKATKNNLQPLWRNFRLLPFQAIKASLADVIPFDGDWSPMDCVHFKELVVDRQFVSVIKKKTLDPSNSLGSYELGLTLIDTSNPDKDVYIHDILVQKGIAKFQH